MLSKSSEKLLSQLSDGLAGIARQNLTASGRLNAALQHISNLLRLLREIVPNMPIKDKATEIWFFRQIKPVIYAARIYELERYNLEQSKPVGTWEKLSAFYEEELEIIRRFFLRYAYFYQYYRSGATQMDELYFMRDVEVPTVLVPEFGEADPGFSTAGDYLFAKFRAYEQLQVYILELLRIGSLAACVTLPAGYLSKPLAWTGESINLVELGYGLFDSAQLNNGKAGVNDIFKWLEEHLNVSIGIPARRFVEIKRRKRLSRTRFLDNMRESINKKIEDDERYEPERQKIKH